MSTIDDRNGVLASETTKNVDTAMTAPSGAAHSALSAQPVDALQDPSTGQKSIPSNGKTDRKAVELDLAELSPEESWWKDRQEWLAQRGYMLRPRFRPGWKPSWLGTKKGWYECEDALLSLSVDALDATRISDEKLVMLKRILTSLHPYEVEIGRLFSEEPFASEPRNHCVPIFETLQDPFDADYQIIVMPFLRGYDKPQFQTIGELAEFWRQAFEGLHFMHEHRVAHRDCMILNIMMDPQPLFPDMYHPLRPNQSRDLRGTPKHYSRTVRPTRYYYIDFGLSRRYPADDVSPREPPIIGGDKTVPEFQGNLRFQPSDPFPTDVYCIGNLIRERYLQEFKGVEFMEKLIEDMTQSDPAKRPTMTEVITRYDQLLDGLNRRKLRERLVHREENAVARLYKDVKHTIITAGYVMRQLPPLPRPPT